MLGEEEEEEEESRSQMSSAASPVMAANSASSNDKRQIQPNPRYQQQPGVKATNERRNKPSISSLSSSTPTARQGRGSKSTTTTPAKLPASTSLKVAVAPSEGSDYEELRQKIVAMDQKVREADEMKEKLAVEERVVELEKEGKAMKEEIRSLRDRLEEGEWAQNRLNSQLEESKKLEGEVEKVRMEVENEKKERKKWEEAAKKEREEMKAKEPVPNSGVGERGGGGVRNDSRKQRCIIFTDSNGREATSDSVMTHIPREMRNSYNILVVVAYTVEDATRLVAQREVDTAGAKIIVDNLTNDV